ncbi:MAG: serine/threonine-protein kinase [Pseudonocardiaceae bacterium]
MIASHYRVLDRIGSGGMGVVWQAMDERLQRVVAVKQLRLQPDLAPRAADEARARALREARIAARLQHPNAIVVYDVAEHDGEPCLVMEYLPSRSLAAVLGERCWLPVADVASIGRQIASALAAAHDAQIVHRDVKPGNILITDDGTAKITDFGVSRAAGDVTVTQTGMVAGTPAYLAPEVARGQLPTPASDVFSLGATLYAAIEGQGPFGDSQNQLALLHAVAGGKVEPAQHAGPLSAVLMRLLAKDPADRPGMRQASLELAAVRTAPVHRPAAPPRKPAPMSAPTLIAGRPDTEHQEAGSAGPGPAVVSSPLPHVPSADSSRPERSSLLAPGRLSQRPGLLVVGVVLAILAFAGAGVLLSGGPSGSQQAQSGGNAPVSAAKAPPGSVNPANPLPPQVQRVDHTQSIAWSDAGQLVIDYYNGLDNPSAAWAMLSPTARATFGTQAAFQSYWGQFSSVSGSNAFGVTDNPDGSVRVPVEVHYNTGENSQVAKRALRVVRLDGRLLIDSDPR